MLTKLRVHPDSKLVIWVLFICIALLELILFKYFVSHTLEHFYPISFDQADYLQLSYRIYENIKNSGLISGLAHSQMLHNGILFPLHAILVFILLNASRFSALLPNLFYFIALQFFILFTLSTYTNKKTVLFLCWGLLLCLGTPFNTVGSLFDFRMDFIAFCLYGLLITATLHSRFFLDRKWSIITGAIAALTILTRCITVAYILPLFTLTVLYLCLFKQRRHLALKQQLMNIGLMVCLLFILVSPYLWLNKAAIYDYYVSTHLLGNEKYIRSLEVGITDFYSYLTFYPFSLFEKHLTQLTTYYATLVLFFYALFYYLLPKQKTANHIDWITGFIFLTLATSLPLLILTLDVSKSSVVGSIAAIPCLWLFFWAYLYFESHIISTSLNKKIMTTFAILIFLSGFYNQVHSLHHKISQNKQHVLTTITKMYQDIGDYAQAKHWSQVHLSVDQIVDYLTASSLTTVYYETRHILLNAVIEKLGGTIFSITEKEAQQSLKVSNVVILNLDHHDKITSPYPFNQSIAQLKPFIENYTRAHFVLLGDYQLGDATYSVYVAPR